MVLALAFIYSCHPAIFGKNSPLSHRSLFATRQINGAHGELFNDQILIVMEKSFRFVQVENEFPDRMTAINLLDGGFVRLWTVSRGERQCPAARTCFALILMCFRCSFFRRVVVR